jgi:hypothetical protein
MTTLLKPLNVALFALLPLLLTGCFVEDPGPRQETERQFSIVDFDRLEMGSGFHVDVTSGNFFSVAATGDRRNIDDLIVKKEGTTLVILYSNHHERRHDTFIKITMPSLNAVNFSGASESRVSGFYDAEDFDVFLSGGSACQLDVDATSLNTVLSGASYLNLRGSGQVLDADISGASAFKAFDFPVSDATVHLSGASDAQITATDHVFVTATGASHLAYRGDALLASEVSGASSVRQE